VTVAARKSSAAVCRVGTAGWANPPEERDHRSHGQSHLQYYATHFNAVEINSSFHRSHARKTYERWAASTPAGFQFSVKAPRTVTHESGLKHCRPEMRQFLQAAAGLGPKLKVILVQTPASLAFERRTAARFFTPLTDSGMARIVIEPRHPSWFTTGAQATLCQLNISRVVADPARCKGAEQPLDCAQFVYYRLHGSPRMYYSAYTEEYLATLSKQMRALRSASREVWCMFDNTARHESWGNALRLRQLLAVRGRNLCQPRLVLQMS
jgi:uncharacterized protein YecE (DUF72 family)